MGVGALIGAVVGGGTFAAGSTIFGASLAASALTGASLGSIFDRKRAASPTYEFGELQNTRSQSLPIPVIYGKVKVGGNLIYHRVSDDNKTIYMAVGLGEGEITGVSDIRANDIPIGDIKDAEWRVYLGTEDQEADPWVLTGERFPHTAYIVAKFAANDQISSTPTITCVVDGLKVPVWDGSQWVRQYTNNPAWALLDFLRSTRYGVGIEDDRIDFDSFAAEATYCDGLVDDGNGGQESRFALDYAIDYEAPSLDVIEDILATYRAYLLYTDGKLRLKVEKSEAPVHAFTMDNIVAESFVYSKASRKDIPNRVVVEWVDPAADYERVETAYDNEIDQDQRGEVYSRTVPLMGVTRPGQAGRMARFHHDSAYWANTFCEFRVGIDALHCEVGDVVQVSHDVPGWDKKLFRILEVEEGEDDEAVLRCREYVPAIYHDRGVVYQPGKETVLPNPVAAPPQVTGLNAVEASRTMGDGSITPVIRVTWTEPTQAYYAGAIVYWRKQGDPSWQRSALVEAPSYDITLAAPGVYQVRVVSENRRGIRSAFETAPTQAVNVQMVFPANVTGLVVDFEGPDAVATWNPVAQVNKYRVRILEADTDDVIRTDEITGTDYTYSFGMNKADNGDAFRASIRISVEARNEAGNYSPSPTEVLAQHPVPTVPTGLTVVPTIRRHYVLWDRHIEPPRLDRYELQFSARPEGGVWSSWVTVSDEIRSNVYPDDEVDLALEYRYRLRAISQAQVESDWTLPVEAGKPGKVSLAEDVIDRLKREHIDQGLLDDIGGLETGLSDATQRLGSAETRLDGAEQALTGVDTRITDAEATLATHADQIAARVTKTVFDALEERVGEAEAELIVQSDAIEAKVEQSVFDVLKGTVESHTATLSVHADAIESKVEQSEFDTLEGTVADHTAALSMHSDQIAARVTEEVFDVLKGRVTDAEAELVIHADEIAARVTKTVFDALENRVDTAETAITQKADQIALTAVEDRVDGHADSISALTVQAGEISSAVASVEDGLTTAQSAIEQNATSIDQRLMVVDENNNPVVAAQIKMAQKDGQGNILVRADNILMEGSVGVRELSTLGGGTQVSDDGVHFYQNQVERMRFGNIGGLPWLGGTVPSGRIGIYAPEGHAYMQGYGQVLTSGHVNLPEWPEASGAYGRRIPLGGEYPTNRIAVVLTGGRTTTVSAVAGASLSSPYLHPNYQYHIRDGSDPVTAEGYTRYVPYEYNPNVYRGLIWSMFPHLGYELRDSGLESTNEVLLVGYVVYVGINQQGPTSFTVISTGSAGVHNVSYAVFLRG